MIEKFDLGDVVAMKKPHACGANQWTVVRTGADVKLRCGGCGRIVMLDRVEFIKKSKKCISKGTAQA